MDEHSIHNRSFHELSEDKDDKIEAKRDDDGKSEVEKEKMKKEDKQDKVVDEEK